ncbi:MAG TPA: hypothetical protein PLL30_03350 [Candidatus Krumholzibacteria bacterium]|nr:hypothetical protein [Candidatus Krumholzibacteria bacterium]HPD70809.1 hypothetical protein [Candidatus Krumholzibacteria bacterium]HRY39491.1 hypothetical protein [Candidatus Krumholzibacteria bacterium]
MRRLRELWNGRLSLADAFWSWLVVKGLVVNLMCTFVALGILAVDTDRDAAGERAVTLLGAFAVVAHLAAVPFNLICVVGVWRSSAAATRPSWLAPAARAAALATFVAYLVI